MSGYPVVPPTGSTTLQTISNLTTTVQKVLYPSPAQWLSISYRLLPGATATAGQYAKVVINAASDADASGKIALGEFYTVAQGDDLTCYGSISRVDVVAAQAVGSEVTTLSIAAGV